jgi:hypothetical protein
MSTLLQSTGTALRRRLATLTSHPVTRAGVRTIASLATLFTTAGQATVIHRLVARLVSPAWLRSAN